MISFSQLLQEKAGKVEHPGPERRIHRRLVLRSTPGELVYERTRMPCQVHDLGLGGCCITVEGRFTAGALAQVEVITTIQGQAVHLYGVTTWTRFNRKIGIRFTHPSATIRMQLEGLVCALFEQADEANVTELDGSAPPGKAILPPEPEKATESADPEMPPERFSLEFLNRIHAGSCRAVSWEDGEWPVQIHYIADRAQFDGSILDLSIKGCAMRTGKPFSGLLNEPIEIAFRLHGLPFLLAGKPVMLDDPNTVGIQFTAMSSRRTDELIQLIAELRASGKYQPDSKKEEESSNTEISEAAEEMLETLPEDELELAALPPADLAPAPAKNSWEHEDTEADQEFWKDIKTSNWDF
jgi:hypothetical protein